VQPDLQLEEKKREEGEPKDQCNLIATKVTNNRTPKVSLQHTKRG